MCASDLLRIGSQETLMKGMGEVGQRRGKSQTRAGLQKKAQLQCNPRAQFCGVNYASKFVLKVKGTLFPLKSLTMDSPQPPFPSPWVMNSQALPAQSDGAKPFLQLRRQSSKESVLLLGGCHNKIPQTAWLR